MKKVMTLVLAMVFVFGMSVAAGAELDSAEVDVELDVAKYAEITTETDSVTLNLDEPNKDNLVKSDDIIFNVRTNTGINVSADWTWDDAPEVTEWAGTESDYVISPNIIHVDENANAGGRTWDNFTTFNAGANKEMTLRVETRWNDEVSWEDLKAAEYEGTLTVTVAAQE